MFEEVTIAFMSLFETIHDVVEVVVRQSIFLHQHKPEICKWHFLWGILYFLEYFRDVVSVFMAVSLNDGAVDVCIIKV